MSLQGFLISLIYLLVMGTCAFAAFRAGAPILGCLAILGCLIAIWGTLEVEGMLRKIREWGRYK